MEIKRERPNWSGGSIRPMLAGILWGTIIMILGGLIVALLINNQLMGFKSSGYGVVASLLASSFVTVLVASRGGQSVWLAALISTIGLILVLLIGNIVLGVGKVQGVMQSTLVVACGSACAVLLKIKPQKGSTYKRKKYYNG